MNKPLENEKTPPPIPDSVRPAVYYMPAEVPQDDEINLVDLWRILARRKFLILLFVCFSTLLAGLYAFTATPIYRAEALLVPSQAEEGGGSGLAGQFGGIAALAGINLRMQRGAREQALAILQSRSFTKQFIEKENALKALFVRKWDATNNAWLTEDGKPPQDWTAFKVFDAIRNVQEDRKTGMISLSVEWKDPEIAAHWANALVKRLNDSMRQQAIDEAEKSIAYLNDQLMKTGVVEIQQSIYHLIESQIKNIMLANSREEFAFKVIDPAVVPKEQIKPKRKMIVILGFMGGLVLAVLTAFAWTWIENMREDAAYEKP